MSSIISTCERYLPVRARVDELNLKYWADLEKAGLLKYRMGDIKNPTLEDVRKMILNPSLICLSILDPIKKKIAGEALLCDFSGSSARVHFSMHPSVRGKESIEIGKAACRQAFRMFPSITTMIGVTPESNRLAVRYLQKCQFEIKCILTNAVNTCYASNKVDNAVISQLTKDNSQVII